MLAELFGEGAEIRAPHERTIRIDRVYPCHVVVLLELRPMETFFPESHPEHRINPGNPSRPVFPF